MKKILIKKVIAAMLSLTLVSSVFCNIVNASGNGAYLYGISCADGYDRYEWIDNTHNALASLRCGQVSRGRYTTATSAIDRLQCCEIFIVHTHGSQTSVQFTASDGTISRMTTEMIDALNSDAFSNAKLVVYGTCSAGAGGSGATNIVNSTKSKGADVVIGFKDVTRVSQMNQYLTTFLKSIGEEKETYQEAMEDAVFWAKFWNLGLAGGTDKPYTRGTLTKTYFD